jgi:hypothetical protein
MATRKFTPRHAVIAYFACFAVGWALLGAELLAVPATDGAAHALHAGRDAGHPAALILMLAAHAALVALVAWKAQRWIFVHGALALLLAGLPLVVLIVEAWLVPAFFYLIALLYVWLAARHESLGKLQATPRQSAASGLGQDGTNPVFRRSGFSRTP